MILWASYNVQHYVLNYWEDQVQVSGLVIMTTLRDISRQSCKLWLYVSTGPVFGIGQIVTAFYNDKYLDTSQQQDMPVPVGVFCLGLSPQTCHQVEFINRDLTRALLVSRVREGMLEERRRGDCQVVGGRWNAPVWCFSQLITGNVSSLSCHSSQFTVSQ